MTKTCSSTNEDTALDRALEEATPLLAESLRRDEQQRRRRRWFIIIGGITMLGIVATIVTVAVVGTGQPDGASAAKPGTPYARIESVAKADELSQKGWGLWQQGQYTEAAGVFAEAIKLDPNSADLWNGLGWSLFHTGERGKAADAFTESLKLNETHPAALNGLGQIAYANRDYKAAKDWFLKAANAPAAQHSLVAVHLLLGEYKQAEKLADELLKTLPADSEDASIRMQRDWISQLHSAAAEGKLTDTLRMQIEPAEPKKGDAADAQALSQRGWALWGERRWRAAELAFLEALEIDPNLPEALNGLGWALISQGKPAEAQKYLERCIELMPDHIGAINGLGLSLKNQGETDRAIKVWEDLYKKAPSPHAGTINLARTYVEQGRYKEAIPLLEQMIAANPGTDEYAQLLEQAHSGVSGNHDTQQDLPDAKGSSDAAPSGNVLANGGFEQGTDGWIIANNSGRMNAALDTGDKAEGVQSLKIVKTGGMPIDIIRINAPGLKPGQTVRVSAKVKSQDVGNAWMKFYVWDADGNVLIQNLDVTRVHGTQNWHTVSRRFKLPDNTDSAAIQFWMILDGTMWIDDVRIEPAE